MGGGGGTGPSFFGLPLFLFMPAIDAGYLLLKVLADRLLTSDEISPSSLKALSSSYDCCPSIPFTSACM